MNYASSKASTRTAKIFNGDTVRRCWLGLTAVLIAATVAPVWAEVTTPANPFSVTTPGGIGAPHADRSQAPDAATTSLAEPNWLNAESAVPRGFRTAIPANDSPARRVLFDATTEDRDLIAPNRIMPLPPVTPPGELPPSRPVFMGPKDGVLQQLSFIQTLVMGGAGDNIRFVDFALKAVLGFPLPTRDSPLLISPGFNAHLVDGPDTTDLPGHLYESYIEFRHLRSINNWLAVDVAFTPGIYGDYSFVDAQTWRYQGRGAAILIFSPRFQIVAGLAYLDREDVKYFPIAGLIWTPSDRWKLELVAPRPRILRELSINRDRQWLAYLGGEFTGNSYTIERAAGYRDVATYHDYRMSLGAERKGKTAAIYWEVGYVFGRHLEYLSGTPSINPGETIMFRTGAYH